MGALCCLWVCLWGTHHGARPGFFHPFCSATPAQAFSTFRIWLHSSLNRPKRPPGATTRNSSVSRNLCLKEKMRLLWVTSGNCRQPFLSQISIGISSQTSPIAKALVTQTRQKWPTRQDAPTGVLRASTDTAELPRNWGWSKVHAPNPSLADQKGPVFPYIPSASPGKGHI